MTSRTDQLLNALDDQPDDNPSAAVGFVALVVLLVGGLAGLGAGWWVLLKVIR